MATKLNNPNISFGEIRYLVRLNERVVGTTDTEDSAIKVLASISVAEEKKLEQAGQSVFRKYLRDGKEIRVFTQTPNRIFGSTLSPKAVIDVIGVPSINYLSPYAGKIAQFKADKARREAEGAH